MVFSSIIFISLFLPAVYILYQFMPGIRTKNLLLMFASILFYSFGKLEWLGLLLASVVINYLAGLAVAREGKGRKAALAAAVILNLALLGIFKYLDFAISILNGILPVTIPMPGIELPIGISFFTFQGMSYVIDVYRNPEEGTKNFAKVILYISLFPQLIAGPIVRYTDVARQIDDRQSTPAETMEGIAYFVKGLTKKLLIADTVAAAVDAVFGVDAASLDIRCAWLAAICYTVQIYFDFSGYSDMAIGLGHMFGFTFKPNFDHPYIAGSITEFWRRWHISLSTWFKEYVYIPLGGNRRGERRTKLNYCIVFFLTGLWHGANWTFILWGIWHGALRMLERQFHLEKKIANSPIGHVYTMLCVILGFTLFRAKNLTEAGVMFAAMFTGFRITAESAALFHQLFSPILIFTLLAAFVLSAPVLTWARDALVRKTGNTLAAERIVWPACIVLLLLCLLKMAATSFSPFIYFQF